MKIIDKTEQHNCNFSRLLLGSIFKFNGDFYMRTETIVDDAGVKYNSINLTNYSFSYIRPDTDVIWVMSELILTKLEEVPVEITNPLIGV